MREPLFDNVGGALKDLAEATARRITLYFGMIGAVVAIGGIAAAVEMENGWLAVATIILAIAIIIYGYNKAHLQVITLYAYGELVEKVSAIDQKLGKSKPVAKTVHGKGNVATPVAKKNNDGKRVCPFCDHENPDGMQWCENCGFELKME